MGKRPNILIFMTDQEQADVVAPDHPCLTPHADRLAQEGIRFDHMFTCTAHCCPSRASFHTGVYPSRHGIFNNVCTPTAINTGLEPGTPTFSEQLREAGYDLVFCGKWHVSREEGPADRGWEELLVTAGKGQVRGHQQSLERWRSFIPEPKGPRRPGQIFRPGWGHYQLYGVRDAEYEEMGDYRTVHRAIDALPRLAKRGTPWCLFIGPSGPHDPFIVPRRFVELYEGVGVPLPPNYGDNLEDKPRIYQRMRGQYWSQLSEEEVRESVRYYWAYCTMMDALFGDVLETLDATGQAEDTLVLFLSDHGEYGGAHGLYMKGVPAFREAYHVPCIARWPRGMVDPRRVADAFITHTDFAATFRDLAGLHGLDEPDSRSLRPFFENRTPEEWRDAHFTQFNGVELYYSQRTVMTRDYKYVYNGFDFDELYDLRNDPHEMRNVADDLAYEDVKHELVRWMWRFAAEQEDERLFNPYGTVAIAPWGPGDALGAEETPHYRMERALCHSTMDGSAGP